MRYAVKYTNEFGETVLVETQDNVMGGRTLIVSASKDYLADVISEDLENRLDDHGFMVED